MNKNSLVLINTLNPFLAKIAVCVGLNPVVFGLFFALCYQVAVASLAASTAVTMAFNHTEWVERFYVYKVGVGQLVVWLFAAVRIVLPLILFVF